MTATRAAHSARHFRLIPEGTGSFVTSRDIDRDRAWTGPVVALDQAPRKPVVADVASGLLEVVQMMDEASGRVACVWSSTTLRDALRTADRAAPIGLGDDDS